MPDSRAAAELMVSKRKKVKCVRFVRCYLSISRAGKSFQKGIGGKNAALQSIDIFDNIKLLRNRYILRHYWYLYLLQLVMSPLGKLLACGFSAIIQQKTERQTTL